MTSLEFTVRRAKGFGNGDFIYIANLKGIDGCGETITGLTFNEMRAAVESALPHYTSDNLPMSVLYGSNFPEKNARELEEMLMAYAAKNRTKISFNGKRI